MQFAIASFAIVDLLLPIAFVVSTPEPIHIAPQIIQVAEASVIHEFPIAAEAPPPAPPTIEQLIDKHAIEAGIPTTTLHAIAQCESGIKQFEDDGSPLVSSTSDAGVFQINHVHDDRVKALGLDVHGSVEDNIKFAVILYKESGTQHWYMSKHCWKPLLAQHNPRR